MGLSVERLLQLRAITPLIELRKYLLKNPEVTPGDAVAALLEIDESFSASDHEAALELHYILNPHISFLDFVSDLRQALAYVLISMRPQWAKRVYLGRARFLSELEEVDTEVRRCFREAGLFVENPSQDVVYWWDRLNHEIRGIQNFENFTQGRTAEQRSLDYERGRLKRMGIELEPKWSAIDDNTIGYDILSYKNSGGFPSNLLIEVKSSSRNPPSAIISRGEWKKAQEAKDNYVFHVWNVKTWNMYEWSVDLMAEHMPTDGKKGQWLSVEIPLSAIKVAATV